MTAPEVVRLPTGKLVLTLLGLCRQGPVTEPVVQGGRAWFQFRGLCGGIGQVGVALDDDEAMAAARRASTDPGALVELAAALVAVAALDGKVGAWRIERVAELVGGGYDANRKRYTPALRGWLALLERGDWQIAAAVDGANSNGDGRARYGGDVDHGPVLNVEKVGDRRATVRVAEVFARALHQRVYVQVPAAWFDLRPVKGWTNRGGAKPSARALATIRIASAIVARVHRGTGADADHAQGVRAVELVGRWAALDAELVTRRRSWPGWCDAIAAELVRSGALDGEPVRENVARETLFRLRHGTDYRVNTRAVQGQYTRGFSPQRVNTRAEGSRNRRSEPSKKPLSSSLRTTDTDEGVRLEAPPRRSECA